METDNLLSKVNGDIHARAPVDRVAARVVFGRGEHFVGRNKVLTGDCDTPPRMRAPTPGAENLTGRRIGRLTVIGRSKDRNGLWVVRCDCGMWTFRRPRSIKNKKNNVDRCEQCRHLTYIKNAEQCRRTGKYVPW